jgi:hypothetical protein
LWETTLTKEGNMKLSPALQAAVASYLRTAVAAVAAMYMSGNTDPKALGSAFAAAILGPLARALNPKDGAFGITK